MTYAIQRDKFGRTPQDLIVLGVRECQNHYAALVQQLLVRTEEFDNASWTKNSTTVTANAATAPDGTVTADVVAYNAANDYIYQVDATTVVTSKAFTGSVWLRVAVGPKLVTLIIQNTAATERLIQQITVTTTWTRFVVHKKFSAVPVDNVGFQILRNAGDDVGDLEMWGANITRNPSDLDRDIVFPYVKRVAEAVGTLAVNASRCQAVDAGDGLRCYYSRPSCQDPDNFNSGHPYEGTAALRGFREYRLCRQDGPLALAGENVAPLLDRFDVAGQEIDAKRGVTVNERVKLTCHDDAGPGVWNPTQQQRGALVNTATGQGTFWRRFVTINRNYANPKGYLIHKAGFVETAGTEAEFQQRGRYVMRNIMIRTDDRVEIECTDRLKLTRKDIPAKISQSNTLASTVDASPSSNVLTLVDAGEVSPPAANASSATPDYFVVLEINFDTIWAEKVNVLTRNLVTNQITVQRGRWGTTPQVQGAGAVIREVAEFGTERNDPTGIPLGKNPMDIIPELYRYAGIDAADIDTATFASERDLWLASSIDTATGAESGVLFRRTLLERKSVEDLVREIRSLVMLMVWVGEDQRVTGKLFAPPIPTETITTLDDDSNLVDGSIEIDDSDESRLTRALIAWGLAAGENGDTPEDFNLVQVNIALDEEEDPYYGEQRADVILSQWLRETDLLNPTSLVARIVSRFRHGARIFGLSLEIKDDSVHVGSSVLVRTDKLQKFDGSTYDRLAIVTRKKRRLDGTIEIDATEMPLDRPFFWAPNGLPDYDAATEEQKRYGFYSDTQGLVGARKEPGYVWW